MNTSRILNNIKALVELKKLNGNPSLLKNYSGWGGLREAIYTPKIYHALRKVISEQDLLELKQTFKSAYYTPPHLVRWMYSFIGRLNHPIKRILEPSAGHGVFIEYMPDHLRKSASIHAVEIDAISCRLIRSLYEDVNVYHQRFEEFTDNNFDLIIGNPPYGSTKVHDANHLDLADVSIHHYFVAKCMRLLNPNGILTMVVPRYFMDAPHNHVRHLIAKEGGKLIAAVRLPDDLFQDAKVTVDIIILRKQPTTDSTWLQTKKIVSGKRCVFLNRYFLNRRHHILGRLKWLSIYGRTEMTCKRR